MTIGKFPFFFAIENSSFFFLVLPTKILLILLLLYVRSKVPKEQPGQPPEQPAVPANHPPQQIQPTDQATPPKTQASTTPEQRRKQNKMPDPASHSGYQDERSRKKRSNPKHTSKKKAPSEDAAKKMQPPQRQRYASPKKKAPVPDQYVSKDFLQDAGFDDEDAQKLMKAIMNYNRKLVQDDASSDNEESDGEVIDKDSRKDTGENSQADPPTVSDTKEKSRGKAVEDVAENEEKSPTKPSNSSEKKSVQDAPNEKESEGKPKDLIENNVSVRPLEDDKDKLKKLVGKQVDGSGNVLDDNGKVIGKVKNDWSHLSSKHVNADGAIVDDSGNIYGNIEAVDPDQRPKKKGMSFSSGGQEDLVVNVDATKSGISFSIHVPRPQ